VLFLAVFYGIFTYLVMKMRLQVGFSRFYPITVISSLLDLIGLSNALLPEVDLASGYRHSNQSERESSIKRAPCDTGWRMRDGRLNSVALL